MPSDMGGTVAGLLVVDKPEGMTSHDVVGRARRALGTRKVGHAGTLDPMATGVLVLGIGQATRLLGLLALKDKSYEATIRLGQATVTDDRQGDVLTMADSGLLATVTDDAIAASLAAFVGVIEQRPSSVSAIKVDGRRAYDRVRAGEDVELPARTVEIASIELGAIHRSADGIDVGIRVTCSTGTYVRAIARDLGDALGVGGHLVQLRRTRVGAFSAAGAVSLDELEERGRECVLAMSAVVPSCFPVWHVTHEQARAVGSGLRIDYDGPAVEEPVAVVGPDGRFVAMAADEGGRARYLAVFVPAPSKAGS